MTVHSECPHCQCDPTAPNLVSVGGDLVYVIEYVNDDGQTRWAYSRRSPEAAVDELEASR